MANIAISDLCPTGANLFQDSESFLNNLTDEELNNTHGGIIWTVVIATAIILTTVSQDAN
jgi:hypothetical protein